MTIKGYQSSVKLDLRGMFRLKSLQVPRCSFWNGGTRTASVRFPFARSFTNLKKWKQSTSFEAESLKENRPEKRFSFQYIPRRWFASDGQSKIPPFGEEDEKFLKEKYGISIEQLDEQIKKFWTFLSSMHHSDERKAEFFKKEEEMAELEQKVLLPYQAYFAMYDEFREELKRAKFQSDMDYITPDTFLRSWFKFQLKQSILPTSRFFALWLLRLRKVFYTMPAAFTMAANQVWIKDIMRIYYVLHKDPQEVVEEIEKGLHGDFSRVLELGKEEPGDKWKNLWKPLRGQTKPFGSFYEGQMKIIEEEVKDMPQVQLFESDIPSSAASPFSEVEDKRLERFLTNPEQHLSNIESRDSLIQQVSKRDLALDNLFKEYPERHVEVTDFFKSNKVAE